MKRFKTMLFPILLTLLLPALAYSQASPASDDASDAVYNDGWSHSDNGGSGFGTWQLFTSERSGHFIGNSNIAVGGNSWGMFANNSTGNPGQSDAIRPFSGSLLKGEILKLSFENGSVNSGGTVGFGLRNSSFQNKFELIFAGGTSNYQYFTNGGFQSSNTSFTADGIDVYFAITGSNSYQLIIVKNGVLDIIDGILSNSGNIRDIRFFNFNAGDGGSFDMFLNSLSVTSDTEAPTSSESLNDEDNVTINLNDNSGSGIVKLELQSFTGGVTITSDNGALVLGTPVAYSFSQTATIVATKSSGNPRFTLLVTDAAGNQRTVFYEFLD